MPGLPPAHLIPTVLSSRTGHLKIFKASSKKLSASARTEQNHSYALSYWCHLRRALAHGYGGLKSPRCASIWIMICRVRPNRRTLLRATPLNMCPFRGADGARHMTEYLLGKHHVNPGKRKSNRLVVQNWKRWREMSVTLLSTDHQLKLGIVLCSFKSPFNYLYALIFLHPICAAIITPIH